MYCESSVSFAISFARTNFYTVRRTVLGLFAYTLQNWLWKLIAKQELFDVYQFAIIYIGFPIIINEFCKKNNRQIHFVVILYTIYN